MHIDDAVILQRGRTGNHGAMIYGVDLNARACLRPLMGWEYELPLVSELLPNTNKEKPQLKSWVSSR